MNESTEAHWRKLENMYASAPINAFYRPTLRVSSGTAEIVQAIRPEMYHAAGAAHGSVYFKALDDAAFFAVNSLVDDVFVLTVSFNIYLLRPIRSGSVRAVGRVVNAAKNLFVAEAELMDEAGTVAGRGSGTFLRSTIPLSENLGYRL